jgi:hypothetical protein
MARILLEKEPRQKQKIRHNCQFFKLRNFWFKLGSYNICGIIEKSIARFWAGGKVRSRKRRPGSQTFPGRLDETGEKIRS